MIVQLLLLSTAFFGAWLMLRPTERFIHVKDIHVKDMAKDGAKSQIPAQIISRASATLGLVLIIAALTGILAL